MQLRCREREVQLRCREDARGDSAPTHHRVDVFRLQELLELLLVLSLLCAVCGVRCVVQLDLFNLIVFIPSQRHHSGAISYDTVQ